jgi:aminomethyltransferase
MCENKVTALNKKHLALNAKMAPFAGFMMPLQYTTVKQEVAAVRQQVGVFDVSHMGEFELKGPDAYRFIDFVLTNNFLQAGDGKAVYSPLCRDNGTIIDDLIAYKISPTRVLLCVNAANIEKDWGWIESKLAGFDCKMVNRSEEYSLIAIQGPGSESLLAKLNLMPDEEFDHYSVKTIKQGDDEIIIARTGYTGEEGVELFASHQMICTIWDKLMDEDVTPCGLVARDVLRLEAGFPLYGNELNDELTPLDCGLKWTVRAEKERFVGREALCDTQKPPKYRQIRLLLDRGVPRNNYPVLNSMQEEVGEVTSGTQSPTLNKGIALASILNNKFSTTESYSIKIRDKIYPAERYKKPFITGGYKPWNLRPQKS